MVCAPLIVALLFASCTRRDYTCSCTYTQKYTGVVKTDETTVSGKNIKEARNACSVHNEALRSYLKTDEVNCYLR